VFQAREASVKQMRRDQKTSRVERSSMTKGRLDKTREQALVEQQAVEAAEEPKLERQKQSRRTAGFSGDRPG